MEIKNLGKKVLDGIKDTLTFLPGINEYNNFNLIRNTTGGDKELITYIGRLALTTIYVGYIAGSFHFNSLNPNDWKRISNERDEKIRIKQFAKERYIHQIDSVFNVDVKQNVSDTTFMRLLNKYTPFAEKERYFEEK